MGRRLNRPSEEMSIRSGSLSSGWEARRFASLSARSLPKVAV